jgi:hypothetical protein
MDSNHCSNRRKLLEYVQTLNHCCILLTMPADIELFTIWSTIEPGMGITAASLATLRPLLRKILRTAKSQNARWFASDYKTNKTDPDPISLRGSTQRGNSHAHGISLEEMRRDSIRTAHDAADRHDVKSSITVSVGSPPSALRKSSGAAYDIALADVRDGHEWPISPSTIVESRRASSVALPKDRRQIVSDEQCLISPRTRRSSWFSMTRESVSSPHVMKSSASVV